MNTRLSLVLPGLPPEDGEALGVAVARQLADDERRMSRFAPGAELASANRAAANGPFPLSEKLFEELSMCRAHWVRTGGAFDITLGAVNDNLRLAKSGDAVSGWEHVDLDAARRTVSFAREGLRFDLGGIGKGIALAALGQLLRERGVAHAFVSFGDSSILTIGSQPSGDHWPVGIRDRFDAALSLHTFGLSDRSVSTSGIDPTAPHLIDASTHDMPGGRRALSIACDCPIDAEVLSTALIVRSPTARAAILANYPAAQGVEFAWPEVGGRPAAEKVWSHAV
jgi:thiamine biosynthesis lipoprotein